jgi:hypothetical protein
MADLEHLDVGMVLDILIEAGNDDADWHRVATQEDFDKF